MSLPGRKCIAAIGLAFFSFLFGSSVLAFVDGTKTAATVKDDCPGECQDAGGGTCKAGFNKVVTSNPNGFKCESPLVCCKGSGVAGAVSCSDGQSEPKKGLGSMPCGVGQCFEGGQHTYADCMTEADCGNNHGIIDANNQNQAGCPGALKCCRIQKNACNPPGAKPEPNTLRRCTTLAQCKAEGAKVLNNNVAADGTVPDGQMGCGKEYPVCCELQDSATAAMNNIGEPVHGIGGTTGNAASGFSGVKRPRKYQNINSFCFTELECSQKSYPGAWVSGNGCPSKGNIAQGYCKAPEPEYKLQYPIGNVSTINGLRNFISLIFNYGMGLILIVSALFFVYGGLRYIFSAVADDVQVAKTLMVDSAVGLALGLGAYAILANVNFNTLSLRGFDVYMINTLSFYDTLYCNDVKPAPGKSEAMFQDAGTPVAPYDLNISKGYTIKLADTKCGQEYFIEGGDSLSVCAGTDCGGKGVCLNCAAGSNSCQTSSSKEHRCDNSNIGGNVIINGSWADKYMQAYFYCIDSNGIISMDQVGKDDMVDTEIKKGAVSGKVSDYGISLDFGKIEGIAKGCSGKSGILLEHHMDATFLGSNALGKHYYYYINKACSMTINTQEFFDLDIHRGGNWSANSAMATLKTVNAAQYNWLIDYSWTMEEVMKMKTAPVRCDLSLSFPSNWDTLMHAN